MNEYMKFQKSTEIKELDLKYMALGLGGEVGEVLNEIKKLERDDNNIMTSERKIKIIEEMGDVLWYMSAMCNRLDTNFDELIKHNKNKLVE